MNMLVINTSPSIKISLATIPAVSFIFELRFLNRFGCRRVWLVKQTRVLDQILLLRTLH